MRINGTFDLAIQLEGKMSEGYKAISQICHDKAISKELMKLSKEETDHMNLLLTGKNYLSEAPDMFSLESERIAELNLTLNKITRLIDNVNDKKVGLEEAVNDAAELERFMEKFHLNRIVEMKDDSLKKLFETLAIGDKIHLERLLGVLESLYRPS
jgi:rubrerythrin